MAHSSGILDMMGPRFMARLAREIKEHRVKNFRVGQKVSWIGQDNKVHSGKVQKIWGRKKTGNYVMTVVIADGSTMPLERKEAL